MFLGIGIGISAQSGRATWSPQGLFASGDMGFFYPMVPGVTLFQDTAGTVPVSAPGDPVGLCRDSSGKDNHASQSTALNRPIYQVDGIGRGYLAFNGTNQWLVTSAITWSSDKASLCVGQRKIGDSLAYLAELSANYDSNAGSFNITAPNSAGANNYSTRSRGDAAGNTNQRAEIINAASPDSAVISCRHDIGGDLTELWRNGVKATSASGDKGAGNFGNYPLYIGGRGGTVSFFTGNIYALTGINRLLSGTELAQLESWTASCTGVTF